MALDSAEYSDPGRFQRESTELFRDYPQFVGPSCMLREPGDFYAFHDTGIPVLVVRRHDGSHGAFLNICTHRGAPLGQGCGTAKKGRMLSCPYHGSLWRGKRGNRRGKRGKYKLLSKAICSIPHVIN